jgi:predicted nucleotidyltransferase
MNRTREEALRVVQEFRRRLASIYGQRLKGVYLYGSFARGQATEDSDVDVAVVLGGPVNRWAESRRTSDLIGELSLRENCVLMPFFLSEQEYRTAPYAIHRSIVREGVPV